MNANPILLQKKYARIVELFAKGNGLSLGEALDIFYHSGLYKLMSEGVSDMHCMSDEYLVKELEEENFCQIGGDKAVSQDSRIASQFAR